MNKTGLISGIRLRGGDISGRGSLSRARAIEEAKEVLATKVRNDLGLPQQVIVTCEFDCNHMMNN